MPMTFGEMVKAARLKRGWKQEDLAMAISRSQGNISDIERGELPKIDIACYIMVILDLNPYEVCINIMDYFPGSRQQIPQSWAEGRTLGNQREHSPPRSEQSP